MFAGDEDGDGKIDLICHRRTDGSLLVALSRGGRSAPLRNRPDTWLVGPDPGTTIRFCTGLGRLDVGDFNGNGIADLRCTNTVGGPTLRSLAGTPSGWYRWENRFGWNGGMRLRTPMAATTPWLAR